MLGSKERRIVLTARFGKGFTLIELAIGLALLSLLLMLGMPALSGVIENGRIKAAASAYASGLQSARALAISRNATVWFGTGGGYSGWIISEDSDGNIPLETKVWAESGGDKVIVTIVPNTLASVSFNALGRPSSAADFVFSSNVNPCETSSTPGARCLRVVLSAGGQVRVCDPLAASGDTRAC